MEFSSLEGFVLYLLNCNMAKNAHKIADVGKCWRLWEAESRNKSTVLIRSETPKSHL